MNNSQQQQFINDMLMESHEGLDRFDSELLILEKGQCASETLHSIFRIIHTLKGTSGCLGFKRIQKLAHAGESLLDLVRNGKLEVRGEMISQLLSMSDALREMLRCIEKDGTDGDRDYEELAGVLRSLQEAPKPVVAAPVPEPEAAPAGYGLFEDEPQEAAPGAAAEAPQPVDPATESQPAAVADPAPSNSRASSSVQGQNSAAQPSVVPAQGQQGTSAAESSIRVDIGLLDKLMNLVGELVLARNQIVQSTTNAADGGLGSAAQRIDIITTELQESVMKTRMQPIGSIWGKYPRIVRDVATELGKSVRLEMEGQDTELDRSIIEAVKDPLTHIIRNSVDHGIETPALRSAAGKDPEGLLHLRAFHEGGQVNIEVSDDGAGIDVRKVRAKAVERGAISQEQASRMTDREAMSLVFLPGLSTAERITNVSGRGVGMDVVKTNIERIGGSIDIQSSLGEGTTLRIKIPLTLAIIPALIVTSCGERFAIPQVSLVELVRLDVERSDRGVENIFDAPVYRLRGKLLPIVFLNRVLCLKEPKEAGSSSSRLLVLKAGEKQFGLVVDSVNDTQEIVVKPLSRHLKGLPVFAGATIMGDGRVALILDVFGLALHARVVAGAGEAHANEGGAQLSSLPADVASRQSLLLFGLGSGSRLAVPLSSVGRLEKFQTGRIEREGGRDVVQYRGRIMPLLDLSALLEGSSRDRTLAEVPVVVYRSGDANVGLMISRIEDIVEESLNLENKGRRPGIVGSAVIQGRVTEIVDVAALLNPAGRSSERSLS